MTSEHELATEFERILDDINRLCEDYRVKSNAKWRDSGALQEFRDELGRKLDRLERISIAEIKLEEEIQRILHELERQLRGFVKDKRMTLTENVIRVGIENTRKALERSKDHPENLTVDMIKGTIRMSMRSKLKEQDIAHARERIMQNAEALLRAAEEKLK